MALLLGDVGRRHARQRPGRTAYTIGARRVTYRELNARVNRLAHTLRAHGVGRGDRVALGEDDVGLCMFHMGGWAMPLGYWVSGGQVVLMEKAEAAEILRAVPREGVTYIYLVPTGWSAVLDRHARLLAHARGDGRGLPRRLALHREVMVAAIVPQPGAALSEEQVTAHVRHRLAGYKKPRHACFVAALPRTASTRQVQKTLLREQWTASRS